MAANPNAGNSAIPDDLRYTKEHEWIRVEGNVATIGITDYAQGELGDIVYVTLPAKGTDVRQMAAFGTVEAVKIVVEGLLKRGYGFTTVDRLLDVPAYDGVAQG